MKIMIRTLLLAIFSALISMAPAESKEEILVHFTGYVNHPGSYRIDSKMTMEELRKTCGGLTQFATTKRMMVIRFPRAEGASEEHLENPEKRKDEILRLHQIPKEGEHFLLKDGDIIYMPGKYYIGR